MRLTCVAGTWAWTPAKPLIHWWQPGSAFCGQALPAGACLAATTPFVWSTNRDGLLETAHRDWYAGGVNLLTYLVPPLCPESRVLPADCVVVAHSHGGQVALYAAAEGLKIDTLVTVATPVRGDMKDVIAEARPNIRFWRHLHGTWRDYVQVLGSIGDGIFGIHRAFPQADENITVRGVTHSAFLNDPQYFERWRKEWLV